MTFLDLFSNLQPSEWEQINSNTVFVTKWNWDYQQAHRFQKSCVEFLKENRGFQVFIFCSHPTCFTNGRGLQKKQGKVIEGLQPFNESLIPKLPYPYHKIERGGGLTFHYPGQFIFYPIVNLTNKNFTLPSLMNWTLETLQSILSSYSTSPVEIKLQEKAGLWIHNKKIASLGFALERYITFHGLALSVTPHKELFNYLLKLNPCGLDPEVYQCFHSNNPQLTVETIDSLFKKSLKTRLSS